MHKNEMYMIDRRQKENIVNYEVTTQMRVIIQLIPTIISKVVNDNDNNKLMLILVIMEMKITVTNKIDDISVEILSPILNTDIISIIHTTDMQARNKLKSK